MVCYVPFYSKNVSQQTIIYPQFEIERPVLEAFLIGSSDKREMAVLLNITDKKHISGKAMLSKAVFAAVDVKNVLPHPANDWEKNRRTAVPKGRIALPKIFMRRRNSAQARKLSTRFGYFYFEYSI